MGKSYRKAHTSEKALETHVKKIKARGGKAVVVGKVVSYRFEKGGVVNYHKTWKVVYITFQGKKGTKEITLGRMSDRDDVKQALRRMTDLNIMEVTSITEL